MHLDLKLSFSSAFEVARKNDEWFIGFKNYKFLVLIFFVNIYITINMFCQIYPDYYYYYYLISKLRIS